MQVSVPAALAGAKIVLPLAPVIGALGVVFGVLATAAGLSPLAAIAMSATTFAGSSQFAAIAVLGAHGSVAAAVGSGAFLNARLLPFGVAIAPALRGPAWKRFLIAQLVVDEAWAAAYVGEGRFSPERLGGAGVVLWTTHVTATAIGTVAAELPVTPHELGLDAAFPALFVILLWPHLTKLSKSAAAVLGAAIALALTPLAPPGVPVVAASLASLLGFLVR